MKMPMRTTRKAPVGAGPALAMDDTSMANMRKKGGKVGAKVHGKAAAARPDRRARGGATSDRDPLTSAGKMSKMPYEAKQAANSTEGSGADRTSYPD